MPHFVKKKKTINKWEFGQCCPWRYTRAFRTTSCYSHGTKGFRLFQIKLMKNFVTTKPYSSFQLSKHSISFKVAKVCEDLETLIYQTEEPFDFNPVLLSVLFVNCTAPAVLLDNSLQFSCSLCWKASQCKLLPGRTEIKVGNNRNQFECLWGHLERK